MKETGPLNRDISTLLSRMGHRDLLCVTDAGLAIPDEVGCVDLSLDQGVPAFLDVLDMVLKHFSVEKAIIAEETKNTSPSMFDKIIKRFPEGTEIELIPHTAFVEKRKDVKGMIRTGEFTAFCNVILVSGAILSKWYIEKE